MSTNQFQYPFNPIIWPAAPVDFSAIAANNDLGYYQYDATQRYVYGTRGITWDGKVFKYCASLDTIYNGRAAWNGAQLDVSTQINSVTPAAYAIGDRDVLVTIASTEGYSADGIVDKNELAGALFVVGHGSAATTEQRTIVGNTAVASGGGTTICTLEYPLAIAHSAGVACEIPLNPYGYCMGNSLAAVLSGAMGVPAITVATGYNFWAQTWGLCWCTPGGADGSIGDSALDRTAYFVGDGTVNGATALTLENGYMKAGYIVDGTEVGTGTMPLVMLQLSV